MGLSHQLGFGVPIDISYFNPATDWFDLGILLVVIGIGLTYGAFHYYNYRYHHAPRRLKPEFHEERRWWFGVLRSLVASFFFAAVIKLVLLTLNISMDY